VRRCILSFRWYDHHTTNTYRSSHHFRDPRRPVAPGRRVAVRAGPLPAALRPPTAVFSLEVFVPGMAAARRFAARSSMRTEGVDAPT